jgi:hypothetical protein
MDTIVFPLKHMESTKLVKHSASDQSHGTFVVQRRHMQKNCETCWIQNNNPDGVIDLPWSSRFVHTKRKKKLYRKNKEVTRRKTNKCCRKRTQKKISRETKKKKKSRGQRPRGRQLPSTKYFGSLQPSGGILIFFPPKKTKRKNLVRQKNKNMETRVCQKAI